MPIYQRYRQTPHIALILVLCALVLGTCRNEPTPEPTSAPPTVAVQENVERPAPTSAPAVTAPEPTSPPPATVTPAPTATPEPADEEVAEPAETPDATENVETVDEVEATEAAPEAPPTPQIQVPGAVATLPADRVVAATALIIRDDETVAPPLSIQVSANRELEGHRYRVSGVLRNDAAEPYTSLGVIATFFHSDGSRYGAVRAEIQCPILGPGDECPFIVHATDRDLATVMLHPEGRPTDRRQPAPVELRAGGRYVDSIGYVHITGSVYNPNPFGVQDITINGVLLDNGQIVSIGSDLILGPVQPGATAPFDVMVRYSPYSQTRLYVQALPPR